jgi:D-3-phosphoglycerate dehydrogenase / 2-oxoglutarate reductase
MARFNVIMTAPHLAAPAVGVLERAGCAVHYTAPYPSGEVLRDLAARVQADAILSRQGQVNATAIAGSPRLKIVARHGVGVDEVDLAAAAARGVIVTNAPGSNTRAVAEHTLAAMFALAKRIKPFGLGVAAGEWRGASASGRDISGLRLGLLGFGGIARAVAALARPFGIELVAFTRNPIDPAFGVPRADSLFALAATSDVLSVHCPLTPATRGCVDAAVLAAMPEGAFVINTARGGIVDEAALLAALDSGHIAGAALDVFATEPPAPNDRLRTHPAVLATPHVAGVTPDSLTAMGVMAAECIAAVLTGAPVPPERIVVPARSW